MLMLKQSCDCQYIFLFVYIKNKSMTYIYILFNELPALFLLFYFKCFMPLFTRSKTSLMCPQNLSVKFQLKILQINYCII